MTKAILGYWLEDGENWMAQLPPAQAADLLEEVKSILKK